MPVGTPGQESPPPVGNPEGEAPPPIEEPAPEGTPINAGYDPNLQRAAPNELSGDGTKAQKKKEKKILDADSLRKHVFNTKRNALGDPGDSETLRRLVSSPFGEGLFSDNDMLQEEDAVFNNRVGQLKKIALELEKVPSLRDGKNRKSKKNVIKG